MEKIKKGKRYSFHTATHEGYPTADSRQLSALFTGEYDIHNGNALLIDKSNIEWSIPISALSEKSK